MKRRTSDLSTTRGETEAKSHTQPQHPRLASLQIRVLLADLNSQSGEHRRTDFPNVGWRARSGGEARRYCPYKLFFLYLALFKDFNVQLPSASLRLVERFLGLEYPPAPGEYERALTRLARVGHTQREEDGLRTGQDGE